MQGIAYLRGTYLQNHLDHKLYSIHVHSHLCCPFTYSKEILKLMKNLMQKAYKTMVFEIILQKGIEKISLFSTCPILCFDFHLQNGNIFVKTLCAIRKYNKIPPQLFQIKFSYLILIKILQLCKTTFSCWQILQIILYISKNIKDYVIHNSKNL